MKHNWLLIASLLGLLTGIITFFLTNSWKLATLAGMLITIAVMINNPERRFIKAFWVVISMILVLNKYFFEFVGDFSGIQFKFGSLVLVNMVTALLVLIAVFCLVLDYFDLKEKSGRRISLFISFTKNKMSDLSENNSSAFGKITSDSNE